MASLFSSDALWLSGFYLSLFHCLSFYRCIRLSQALKLTL